MRAKVLEQKNIKIQSIYIAKGLRPMIAKKKEKIKVHPLNSNKSYLGEIMSRNNSMIDLGGHDEPNHLHHHCKPNCLVHEESTPRLKR